MKSTDFMRSVFFVCVIVKTAYMKIGEKKSVNPQKSIRILQPYHSHIAGQLFAFFFLLFSNW